MFKRIYVHNFRCLENFALPVGDKSSVLLIGKNGAGKSTVSFALALLQKLARGTNRVGQLVTPKDFFLGRADAPMRFEVRVLSERLMVAGQPVYSREHARVSLTRRAEELPAEFGIDWHLIALPIIQEQSETDPVLLFKRWLARSVIIAPIPCLITGESAGETLEPDRDVQNLGAWFAGLIAHSPAAYATIDGYLKNDVMPDFWDVKNPIVGGETRSLTVQFRHQSGSHTLPFATLSDGEKCFFICALVLAANAAYGPIFCFWDEPDSHLAIDEVGYFITALRRSFENGGGQVLMTSHNSETIRRFSDENTMVLLRESHLEPTRVKTLEELGVKGELINTLLRGDVGT
jgi:predicted ATPase